MKIKLGIISALFTCTAVHANPIFTVPSECEDPMMETGICVQAAEAEDERGSVDVKAYVLVYKDDFESLDVLSKQYFDWTAWPSYYEAAEYDKTEMVASTSMPNLDTLDEEGNTRTYIRNYFIVDTRIPIIGKQRARGVSFYENISTEPEQTLIYSFSLPTGEVEVPEGEDPLTNGPEGLAKQDGQLYFSECTNFDICGESEFIIHYTARLRHRVPILANYAAQFTYDQIEALFTGMYLR